MDDSDRRARFEAFVDEHEPRLRRALVAAYGPVSGRDATATALGWAWEHWDRLAAIERPTAYLYRVGQTSLRARKEGAPDLTTLTMANGTPEVEPRLMAALRDLTDQQRTAVVLVHGYGYGLTEAADVLGVGISTLRNHLARGLARLRDDLEVEIDA